jgi:2C-methyl-D-erythritol 2,4-cyclodiphosphate synthase
MRLSIARDAAASALTDALDAAVAAIDAGEVSERAAAGLLGVDRNTIRKHSGKDPRARRG